MGVTTTVRTGLAAAGATGRPHAVHLMLILVVVVLLFGAAAWRHLAAADGPAQTPSPAAGTPPVPLHLGMLLGGDVLLDLEPGSILASEGPEALLAGWLSLRRMPAVDLAFANLECPLSLRGSPWEGKKFTFRADPARSVRCLTEVRFDVLSLANNHALDYGPDAMLDTIQNLEQCGIAFSGAGLAPRAYAPAFVDKRGFRIAFLAFCNPIDLPGYRWLASQDRPGVAVFRPLERALAAVSEASSQADLVVVSCHWGAEYSPVTEEQRQVARALIDAGADLVFGHHPHIPQAVEVYRGKPILYSLGNLVFHPFQSRARGMCAALVYWYRLPEGAVVPLKLEVYPLSNDGGRTVTMPPGEAAVFLADLASQSAVLGTEFRISDTRLVLSLWGQGGF